MPDFPTRPALPPHLLAQLPTNLINKPFTREQAEILIDGLIQSLQSTSDRHGMTVQAEKDQSGWTIRVDLPSSA